MSPFNASVLQYLSDIDSELKKIKGDISSINENIETLKKENATFMMAFPDGIEEHRIAHKKKKWLIF